MSIANRINEITKHLENDYTNIEALVGEVSVDKNIENIAPLLDNLWEELPKVTGSGTSLSINNTKKGKMKLYLSGNTGQDGTPTPDAPQTIHKVNGNNTITTTGKNLLNLEDGTFTDGSNLTVKIENQKVILNGTTSSDYLWLNLTKKDYRYGTPNTSNKPLWFSGAIIKAGTYIGSISDDNITFNVCQSDGSRNGKTNISSSYDICSACLYIGASGTTFNNKEITLQIEKGSTASSIEKYQSSSYSLNLPVGMELNKISTYKDGFIVNSGKNLISQQRRATNLLYFNGAGRYEDYIFKAGTYTFSYVDSNSCTAYMQKDGGSVIDLGNNKVINITSDADFNFWLYRSGLTDGEVSQAMLIEGTYTSETMPPYEPYGSGEWYYRQEIGSVTLNGSENYTNATDYYYILFSAITPKPKPNSALFSNYFVNTYENGNGGIWAGTGAIAFNKNGLPNTVTDLTSFKNWLSSNNTTIYYQVATPTYTKITDSTLLDQLNAVYRANSYKGQTNINQVNNDLPFNLDATALEG